MSEQKTAKIVEILEIKPWDGPNGRLYFHKLLLDNDEVGTVGKKKENAFSLGESFTYTAEKSEYGYRFKEVKEDRGNWSKGGGKSFSDPKSYVLSYAKDVIVAAMNNGWIEPKVNPFQAIMDGADTFLEWYEGETSSNTLTDIVSVTDTEFNGNEMRAVPAVIQGSPPEIEAQRSIAVGQAFETPQKASNDERGPRDKPALGGTGIGGKPASDKQMNLLKKIASEKGININQMIAQEWTDISDVSELSSWGTSYLLDKIFGNPTK